ncbi:MAG: trimethylamine methyltransferase family protein [Eubacterium sp.]|nr:trimethylamine methyltransferase family protein [Eubacterium sp.]
MSKFVYPEDMQYRILTKEQVETVHENTLYVLENLGMIFSYEPALKILENAGCKVDYEAEKVWFPRDLVEKCIETAPASFDLYDRNGDFYCTFGDGKTRFNPGSSSSNVLESDNMTARLSNVRDLKRLTRVAQSLPHIDFVSSSVVCEEAPGQLGSQYLYYTEMQNSTKPIIGGATDAAGVPRTFELLKAILGSEEAVRTRPYTIFDICVTSPMRWSTIGARNIIDCVERDIPIELISAQIAGATGPVTLAGCILQHAVEMVSGLVLAQVVKPGHPVVFGGAPCIFNMKTQYTPMEAMECSMITCAYAQMGKFYGLPTHTYAAMSDSKIVDYQAGSETARSGILAKLVGIDNVSGAGGLNVIAEMSIEKLVVDNDFIGTVKHMEKGIRFDEKTLAADLLISVGSGGNFLNQKHTLKNYRKEQNYSNITQNYEERATWMKEGAWNEMDKAREYVEQVAAENACPITEEQRAALDEAFIRVCADAGLSEEVARDLIRKYDEA